jgi:pyruvate/2-oxoglutarate dehydrogenase complex dihydrolipoamide dehydrogenase (E3) component
LAPAPARRQLLGYAARLYAEMRDAGQYGARIPADARVDFAAAMERMRGIRARISRADSVRRLIAAGVDVFFGQARFTGTDALSADGWPLFLPREERDAAQLLSDAFARDGIEVRLNIRAVAVRVQGGQKFVDLVSDDHHSTVAVDAIPTGTGRVPNVDDLNLEGAGGFSARRSSPAMPAT